MGILGAQCGSPSRGMSENKRSLGDGLQCIGDPFFVAGHVFKHSGGKDRGGCKSIVVHLENEIVTKLAYWALKEHPFSFIIAL